MRAPCRAASANYWNREDWAAQTLASDAETGLGELVDNFRDRQRFRANIRWERYRAEKAEREAGRLEAEERAALLRAEELEAHRAAGGAKVVLIGPHRVRQAVVEQVKMMLDVSRVGSAELERAGFDPSSGTLADTYLVDEFENSEREGGPSW